MIALFCLVIENGPSAVVNPPRFLGCLRDWVAVAMETGLRTTDGWLSLQRYL